MNIQLSDHFTYRRLIRFTISTVLMLICTSMYSIVDGLFVSNYVGKMPFAATNLIWPVSMGIAAIGFMLGTGGSAIVAKTLGEGKKEKANQYFSMILYFGIIVSVIFFGYLFYLYAANCPDAQSGWRTFGTLHRIRKNSFCDADGVYFAEYVSKLSRCRGRAGFEPEDQYCGRTDERCV